MASKISDVERDAALPDLVRLVVSHDKVAHGANAALALRQTLKCL